MVKPAFRGQFKDRPSPEVLLELYRWRLTGTLAVWPEVPSKAKRTQDRVRIENGLPTKGYFIEPCTSLRQGLLQVMQRSRALFAFYDGDLVGDGKGVIQTAVSVYELVAENVRRAPRREVISRSLQSLSQGKIRVRTDVDLDSLQLRADERDYVKLLSAAPGRLADVRRFGKPEVVDRVLYLLSLMNALELEIPPQAVRTNTLRPPKLQTGILTEGMYGPGVYLSSQTNNGPRNVRGRDRRQSGIQTRKTNSVPPKPLLAPTLEKRWDALVNRVLLMDEQDHFQVLGLEQGADEPSVMAAYLNLAMDAQPNALPAELSMLKPFAHRFLARIVEAKTVLTCPHDRAAYIAELDRGRGVPANDKKRRAQLRAHEFFVDASFQLDCAEWDAALVLIRQGLALDYKSAHLLAAEAWALFNRNPSRADLPEYLALLKQALSISPNLEEAHYYLACIHERMGNGKEARECFRTLLKLNPNHVEAKRGMRRKKEPEPTKRVVNLFGRRKK